MGDPMFKITHENAWFMAQCSIEHDSLDRKLVFKCLDNQLPTFKVAHDKVKTYAHYELDLLC